MKNYLFILLCCCVLSSYAQDSIVVKKDIKVGLVLSGGGAKGLAHIGAIKAIEEAGIKVDYIGGTSMGAIVGGLYASGYNAKQLDSIFKEVNFNTLIRDDIPRGATTFYEKAEAERYAVTLPFDQFKIGLPSGLSRGQNVYNLMSKLTSHVSTVTDFKELPIPFFCMATNVETGEQVLLENGYLPKSIIASGALPSLFSPVIIDDTVLIDGGVVNNYPVDEMWAKGVDVVIGVDVQDDLLTKDEMRSGFDVLVQINNYSTIAQMTEKRKKTDVYIQPDIEDFNVVSFDQGNLIIQSGYEAALKKVEALEKISEVQSTRAPLHIEFLERDKVFISGIEIQGAENYTRSYVLGKLKLKTPAEVSYSDFSDGLNNLSATGNYESIDYRFVRQLDGSYLVRFSLIEADNRNLLRLGVHYDDLYNTSALVNFTRKRLLTNNDIASLDVIVGDNFRYEASYYIDKGFYWSIGLKSTYNFFDQDVPVSLIGTSGVELQTTVNEIELQYNDFTNQLFFETLFKRSFLVGLGAEHKYLRLLTETVGGDAEDPRTIFESTNYYSAYGYSRYDTLDDPFYPSSGFLFDGDFHLYLFSQGSNENFDSFSIAKAKVGYATEITTNISLFATTEGGFKLGNDATRSNDFLLGGYGFKNLNNIVPFYGYEALHLRGNTYLKTMVSFDYELFEKNHLQLFGNIANVGDDLFVSGQWIDGIDFSGFGLGYGIETFLGPIEVKYAYSPERDNGEWYIAGGFRF